jgi:alpha-glucosidase
LDDPNWRGTFEVTFYGSFIGVTCNFYYMKYKALFSFLLMMTVLPCLAQVTFVIHHYPEKTLEKEVFITGNFDQWSGGKDYRLTSTAESQLIITLPAFDFPLEYKFTQGNWDLVETDENGASIDNRNYSATKEKDTVLIEIKGWHDPAKEQKETKTKNVVLLSEGLANDPSQLNHRKIWAYLPPDYHETNNSYPVIYMHDGQNLFDAKASFRGEWEVDEQMNVLFEQNDLGVIVIGIDNGGSHRLDEYTPWKNDEYGGGMADVYLDFLIEMVMPLVEKELRIKTGAQNTAMMGSSLGGLVSYYAGLKRPDLFGKIGAFSTSFWYSEEVKTYSSDHGNIRNQKMYLLAGNAEDSDESTVKDTKTMAALLLETGYPSNHLKTKYVKEGKHNEQFWKNEFTEAVRWLFQD